VHAARPPHAATGGVEEHPFLLACSFFKNKQQLLPSIPLRFRTIFKKKALQFLSSAASSTSTPPYIDFPSSGRLRWRQEGQLVSRWLMPSSYGLHNM
jgi:hypothetical protein